MHRGISFNPWDDVNKRKHTRLYNIEPIGLGTPFVEGLVSYICRLAKAHRVSTTNLLLREILPKRQQGLSSVIRALSQSINGHSKTAQNIVSSLEALTGRDDLASLTMIPLQKIVAACSLIRKHKAWCPLCYDEWARGGQVLYDPLQWSLQAVKRCSIHKKDLLEYCPQCQKQMYGLEVKNAGYCNSCNHWLGHESKNIGDLRSANKRDFWDEWVAFNVNELMQYMKSINEPINTTAIMRNLKQFKGYISNNFSTKANKYFCNSTVYKWVGNKHRINFHGLLLVGYLINTPIVYLISEEIENSDNLIYTEKPNIEIRLRNSCVKSKVEDELLNGLKEAAALADVSGKCGASPASMRKLFPRLCKMLVNKRKQNQKEEKEKKLAEIREVTIRLHRERVYPSQEAVTKQLSWKPACLSKAQFIEWQTVRKELGITRYKW